MEEKINGIPKEIDPDHPWFEAVREIAAENLSLAEIQLNRMFNMLSENFALEKFRELWKQDAELFHVKQSALERPDQAWPAAEPGRMPTVRNLTVQEADWKERYGELRKKFRELLKKADEVMAGDGETAVAEWRNMRDTLRAFQLVTVRTDELFQRKKRIRSVADFSDLEQYAVQILSTPTGREDARETWRYVFVDECQDISAVQNRIIDLMSCEDNHLFMVGDVKQSIYRFRLADPLLFLDRINRCRDGSRPGSECIHLQSNFRSRWEILESSNLVFRSVMRASVAEISYTREEELIPGRKTEGVDPVAVVKIDRGEHDISNLEAQADFIQDEIRTLLQTPYPEEKRNYRYRDCVILMPAVQTDGPLLADLLKERNIPVFFDGGEGYYQLREIQEMRNLLEWIDFPLQDLPLISVLQGLPFSFTDEELSLIRLEKPEKDVPFHQAFAACAEKEGVLGDRCREVLAKLKIWQEDAELMRVEDLIWKLYMDTGVYFVIAAEEGGEVRQANLRVLARQAADAESKGILTLRQFLEFTRDQAAFGDQTSATLLGEQDDLVRIMTIHKSKGLQFPVVFCAGMDKGMNGRDSGRIGFHSRLGLCAEYKDPENRIARNTLAEEIFSWKRNREETAEKIRLLYVAMTRAREKLYMLTCQDVNPVWSMPEGDARVLSAKSYTDLWMPVFLEHENDTFSTNNSQAAKPYEIRVFECNPQKTVENDTNIHSLRTWLETLLSVPPVEELWKKDPENPEDRPMVKRSVTSLIRSARKELEEDTEEETAEKKRMPDALARRLIRPEMPEVPEFMREQGEFGAAWKGTLTHRILSLMDLDAMRGGESPEQALRELKERMIRDHMVSEKELSAVSGEQIVSFWKSETGERILRAEEVHREWNFNLRIRGERDMILQGVVDCAFREADGWVILDYKTDRGKSPEEMAAEYRPQLEWYARAVGEITGQPVKETALYSLSLDRVIPV